MTAVRWRDRAWLLSHHNKYPVDSEKGSILLLIVGLCLVLLLVASTVVAVSSVYLERHRLQALADQSASAAAQRVEGISSAGADEAVPRLHPTSVNSTVQTFIVESGAASDFNNLIINPATGVSTSNTAVVVLNSTAYPPLLSVVVPDGVPITVTGRARVQTTQQQ